ncbi:MAG: hypothetical protein CMP14_08485 [Rickettsiales bacterium]|nr:hypothetical protein [Rickettsiales bacterium]|tara:strand:- start:2069 stop:2335 length:267 start_codon:yes stop_codon:yes gene_type:complete
MENNFLSPLEVKTLKFIKKFISEYGCSPTYRQISKGIGKKKFYPAGISAIVNQLENKKKIERTKFKNSSIRLTPDDPRSKRGFYEMLD